MNAEELAAIEEKWLQQCGPCDGGLPMSCTHPTDDYRPVILALLAAVRERDNTIAEVRALHYMIRVGNNQPVRFKACGHCGRSWPCATITALDEQETP